MILHKLPKSVAWYKCVVDIYVTFSQIYKKVSTITNHPNYKYQKKSEEHSSDFDLIYKLMY